MVSTKGRYALRLMIDLAVYAEDGYIPLKEISEREEISLKYLEQVAARLIQAGLLMGLRGNQGGYRLSKPAKDYTAGEILRAAEGTLAPVACLEPLVNPCRRRNKCSTIEFWQGYYEAVAGYVDGITLEELAVKEKENKKK